MGGVNHRIMESLYKTIVQLKNCATRYNSLIDHGSFGIFWNMSRDSRSTYVTYLCSSDLIERH